VIAQVPAETPVTTPVKEPTVAMEGVELLHVPPKVASINVVDVPTMVESVPPMAAGAGVTVTVW